MKMLLEVMVDDVKDFLPVAIFIFLVLLPVVLAIGFHNPTWFLLWLPEALVLWVGNSIYRIGKRKQRQHALSDWEDNHE